MTPATHTPPTRRSLALGSRLLYKRLTVFNKYYDGSIERRFVLKNTMRLHKRPVSVNLVRIQFRVPETTFLLLKQVREKYKITNEQILSLAIYSYLNGSTAEQVDAAIKQYRQEMGLPGRGRGGKIPKHTVGTYVNLEDKYLLMGLSFEKRLPISVIAAFMTSVFIKILLERGAPWYIGPAIPRRVNVTPELWLFVIMDGIFLLPQRRASAIVTFGEKFVLALRSLVESWIGSAWPPPRPEIPC